MGLVSILDPVRHSIDKQAQPPLYREAGRLLLTRAQEMLKHGRIKIGSAHDLLRPITDIMDAMDGWTHFFIFIFLRFHQYSKRLNINNF